MRAARRVRVGAVDVGVGGPVLDEEAVAAAARGVGVVAAAKHPVELGEHPASDVCVRQPPHPLRPRARHKADDGVGRRRVGPHQLGGGREPHLRQERVGADGVVKVGRPEAAPQPHDHLERGPHLELANRSCLRRRQRRPKLRLPPLQYGQRHGDDAGARAHHSAVGGAELDGGTVRAAGRRRVDALHAPRCPHVQAATERLHRVLQAGASQHQVLLAVRPVALLVHHLVQPDIRHVRAVIVGKDGIGQVEHARGEAAAGKVLQQRRLLLRLRSAGRRSHLTELLEALVHQCDVRLLVRLLR
mmetsp:Transcript_19391/g.64054  ORF Transcript_19391/g.64054 Transcript_19391/m.64054 type:complete len:302 (-) Transcript_19391:331-1236(-)